MTMPAQFPALQQRGLAKFIKLALNFSANETLDPRITFSRTSNATRVNAQGLIEYAPHNLLTYSEQFDNAAWSKADGTIAANSVVAPDGTTTADIYTVGTSSSVPSQNTTIVEGNTYCISIHFHSLSTAPFIRIRVQTATGSTSAFINTATKTFGTVLAQLSNAIVTDVGNGWYRASVNYTPNAGDGGTRSIAFAGVITNNSSTAATGTTLVYWGAQFNIGSLQPYYTTSVKNLLGYSQNFENAAWTKSNSTIDATPVMGPLGFLGAEKLVEDTTNAPHYIRQFPSITTPVAFSVYAKAGERTKFQLDCYDATNDTRNAVFNLVSGTVETILGAGVSANIIALSNGWYRCCMILPTSATGGDCKIALYTTSNSYLGDGTSGIYIFGAQLSDSASLDPYVYNFGAAPTSSAYYGPRFDYDPVTLAPKGLLIEEQRINILLNSDTLSTQSVSVTAQAYTLSFYGTGSVALSGAYTGSLVGTGVYPNRVQLTFTPTIGTLTLTVTGSVRYANLEAGSFPTSYIPTTTTQVTRTADNASMVGTNFSSWYNQSEGTVSSSFDVNGVGSSTNYNGIVCLDDGSAGNAMTLSMWDAADDSLRWVGYVTNTSQWSLAPKTYSSGVSNGAGGYQINNFNAAFDGILGTTDNSGSIPIVNIMRIGTNRGGNDNYLNGHIKSIKYFNKRLLNSYLQSLTQ